MGNFIIHPDNLDFSLPLELIAQEPLSDRSRANLMVLKKADQTLSHCFFSDLLQYLNSGDVLVINTARVRRAKFFGRKKTGGKVEAIFLEPLAQTGKGDGDHAATPLWKVLLRPQIKLGETIDIQFLGELTIAARLPDGEYVCGLKSDDAADKISSAGILPLPPYIKRSEKDPRHERDLSDYQTVYSSVDGAIAAPTAGLHFTNELLKKIEEKGVQIIPLVLHVGWGTFKPVSGRLADHKMLSEKYEFEPRHLAALYAARKEGKKIFAVGTTVTRVLESLPDEKPQAVLRGETNIFIQPGYKFRWINGLITNFHVPRSTPIALTAAFSGLQFLTQAYEEAIRSGYRFFSYGDAMLVF